MRNDINTVYELMPIHDGRKSFYGKATVRVCGDESKTLFSYGTPVVDLDVRSRELRYYPDVYMSQTTRRHLREFLRQEGVGG